MAQKVNLPRLTSHIRDALLAGRDVQPPIDDFIKQQVPARQELVEIWDGLSKHGRMSLLTAARLIAQEEGLPLRGRSVFVSDSEVR